MGVVWANWKVAASRKLRVCVALVTVVSALWLMVAGAAGFDTWDYWLHGPLLMWTPVLVWWTFAAYRLQHKLAGLPLSFCLPGYRESLRRLSFAAAIPTGVAGAVFLAIIFPYGLFATFPEVMPRDPVALEAADKATSWLSYIYRFQCPIQIERWLRVAAGCATGMAMALSAGTPRLILSRWGRRLAIPAACVVYFVGLNVFIVGYLFPLVVWPTFFLVGGCTCVFVWMRQGNMAWVAQSHRAIVAEVAERKQVGSRTRVGAWIEHPFVKAMERYRHAPGWRYLWGSLYCAFGPTLSRWRGHVIGLAVVAIMAGYYPWGGGTLVFVVFTFVVALMDLPVVSSLVLPAGRRERCRATIATTLGACLLLAVAGTILVLLSQAIGGSMPGGREVEFVALDLGSAFLPSLLVPGLVGYRLLACEVAAVRRAIKRTIVAVALGVILLLDSPLRRWTGVSRPLLFAGVLICAWVFFLLTLRRVCLKECLIGQTVCDEE